MKFIAAAFALLVVAFASVEANHDEMMAKAAAECMEELDMMKDVTEMEADEGRCLVKCMMDQMKVIKAGKVNKEQMMEVAAMMTDDADKLSALAEAADECDNLEDPDDCAEAYAIYKCLRAAFTAEGLDHGEDMFANFD